MRLADSAVDEASKALAHDTPRWTTWTLCCLLVAPIACSGATSEPGTTSEEQIDLMALIPATAASLGWFGMAELRQSPIFELATADDGLLEEGEKALDSMVRETGIDPLKDIDEIVFGGLVATDGQLHPVLIAAANFDRQGLASALADRPSETYGDHTIYSVRDTDDEPSEDVEDGNSDSGDDSSGETAASSTVGRLVILDDHTLVMGADLGVRQVLEVAGGTASVRTNAAMMTLLEDVPAASQAWILFSKEAFEDHLSQLPEGAPIPTQSLRNIEVLLVAAELSEEIRLEMRGRSSTPEDAKLLGDSISGLLAMGKMLLQSQEPELFAILDRAVRVESQTNEVSVHAHLTMDDLTTLRRFAEEQAASDEAAG